MWNIDNHRIYTGSKQLLAVFMLGAIYLFAVESHAAIAFQQLPTNGSDVYPSIPTEQTSDDFVLPTNGLLNTVTWWGSYAEDPAGLPDDWFRVSLFNDDGSGNPTSEPFASLTEYVSRSLTGSVEATGKSIYRFEMVIPGSIHLTSVSSYYLSIVNQFGQIDPNAYWYWLLSDTTGRNFFRFSDNEDWQSEATGNMAFTVSTVVPLPSAIGFWLTGSVLIAFVGRKRCDSWKLFGKYKRSV